MAARLARALDRWKKLAEPWRTAAREAIARVATRETLSNDVREVILARTGRIMENPMAKRVSLTRYLVEQQRVDGLIPGQLRLLLEVVARACKASARPSTKAPWAACWAAPTARTCRARCKAARHHRQRGADRGQRMGRPSGGMASEEMDAIYVVPNRYPQGEYLLLFDPLDGSSNIDVNVSIGTIFSVLRMPEDDRAWTKATSSRTARSRWPQVTASMARRPRWY